MYKDTIKPLKPYSRRIFGDAGKCFTTLLSFKRLVIICRQWLLPVLYLEVGSFPESTFTVTDLLSFSFISYFSSPQCESSFSYRSQFLNLVFLILCAE
jgi:hypothetical protein